MLKAVDVSYTVGGREILSGASCSLRPGVLAAMLGPNGSGKSTLLRLMAGALKPTAGLVSAAGMPLSEWDNDALSRRRAVLSQESQLSFNFTAFDVVLMGRLPHHAGWESRHDMDIAYQVLATVGAEHLGERTYLTLSGGERQRINLARALAQIWEVPPDGNLCTQRCLLLDEPVNNLDLQYQHQTLRIARRIANEGVAVLAVLHDLNLALEYAEELFIVVNGRVEKHTCGQPEQLGALLSSLFQWPLRIGINPFTDALHSFSVSEATSPALPT